MNEWELLEVREMVLRDLFDFIPPNLYGTPQFEGAAIIVDAAIDVHLGKELKMSSKREYVRMTIRQRRAANLLWQLGLCGVVAEEIRSTEEENRREQLKEGLVALQGDLPDLLESYAACLSEEERKLLPILRRREENTNQPDTLKDSERNSLLKLVIGMAIGAYRYDPAASKNNAVSDITEDLEKLGIPLSDDTVRKYLKMATAQLPRKPHQV